jgi:hypothetical protein
MYIRLNYQVYVSTSAFSPTENENNLTTTASGSSNSNYRNGIGDIDEYINWYSQHNGSKHPNVLIGISSHPFDLNGSISSYILWYY